MRTFYTLLILFACFSCTDILDKPKNSSKINELTSLYQKAVTDTHSIQKRRKFIDNALKLCKDDDSLKTPILYTKCGIHFQLQEYDSLYHYGKRLQFQAEKAKNRTILGKYFHLMAYYHSKFTYNQDSAFYYQNLAKNEFLAIRDSTNVGRRLIQMGIIQHNKNDYFGSKETCTEAFQYLRNSKDLNYKASALNELATSNRKLYNYQDAIALYKEAIKTTKSERLRSIYKNNLAAAYTDNGAYKKAIEILQKLVADTLTQNDRSHYARILDNLAYARWLDREKVTESQFVQPLQIRKKNNDKRGQIASYTHLGEYFSQKAPKKAQRYLDTVIQLSKQLKIPKAEQDALKFLMGFRPSDVKIRNRYVLLQDSLYRVGLKVKTQFAKMKYDDELKQRAILELEAETANKNIAMAEQETQKTIWLSVSGLLLVVGISFFYGLRQLHKKEKLQEIYITEQRISKRVHDELANDIYGAMTKVQHTTQLKKEEMLNDLEQIYLQTRKISHENAEVPTGNEFVSYLKQLLATYQNENTVVTVKGFDTARLHTLDDNKKVALYRALNELMVNMKKHSSASLTAIAFEHTQNTITIKYVDNGIGYVPSSKKGVGLRNTENRIKKNNGTFIFESEQGKGFRATITFSV